jgi:hypothetical protein
MESGYGVFWIITDALNELNKWENNKIPYFSKIHLWIDYVWKLLQEWKVKVKIKESDNQGISRLYQGPEDSKVFIADARLLLDKKSKQWIENEENGVFDPYSWFFDLVHHEIYITLPYKDFWDETK